MTIKLPQVSNFFLHAFKIMKIAHLYDQVLQAFPKIH